MRNFLQKTLLSKGRGKKSSLNCPSLLQQQKSSSMNSKRPISPTSSSQRDLTVGLSGRRLTLSKNWSERAATRLPTKRNCSNGTRTGELTICREGSKASWIWWYWLKASQWIARWPQPRLTSASSRWRRKTSLFWLSKARRCRLSYCSSLTLKRVSAQ